MVQLDSIGILARAHHHILWSRQSAYRQADFDKLLTKERRVFEHFSHDAVVLPMSTYPYWQRQRERCARAYKRGAWGRAMANQRMRTQIIKHIEQVGPVCSRDLTGIGPKANKKLHTWMRPAHKLALDYLWLSGTLSVSHRHNFHKYYDLTERIIPTDVLDQEIDDRSQINWLCENALQRLGFASAIEIQRFWDACTLQEVRAWLERPSIAVIPVEYKDFSGKAIKAYSCANLENQLARPDKPTSRLRIVNPFDPVVRDRNRLKRLFDFDYRIEIYTPAAKRQFGYYVYPLLENGRMIGRIDVRTNRERCSLDTRAWWLEPGVADTQRRRAGLCRELTRLAKLAGVNLVSEPPPPKSVQLATNR